MFGRSNIADDGPARMDADSQAANGVRGIRMSQLNAVENPQCTKAALQHHVGAVKNGHHTITAELVDVSAVRVDDIDLFGQERTHEGKQLAGLQFFGKRRETADIGKANGNAAFFGGRHHTGH